MRIGKRRASALLAWGNQVPYKDVDYLCTTCGSSDKANSILVNQEEDDWWKGYALCEECFKRIFKEASE